MLKMIVFPFAHYYHEDSFQTIQKISKNTLIIPKFSGEVEVVDSKIALKQMFSALNLTSEIVENKPPKPLIGNVVCANSAIQKIRLKTKKLFGTVPVDIYFITLLLAVIDNYYVIDEPLLIWSEWSRNSSVNIKGGNDLRQHYERLLDGEKLEFVPLKFALPLNCAANAVLKANADLGNLLESIEIEWNWYFVKMYEYLTYLDSEGVDISEEIGEFNKVLLKQPVATQDQIRQISHNLSFKLKNQIKKKLWQTTLLKSVAGKAKKYFYRKNTSDSILIQGKLEFSNVLESANYLDFNICEYKSA